MEDKTFIEKHIEYHNSKIPSENCSKKFCKICDHRAFKDRMTQFYSLPKTYNYQRYRWNKTFSVICIIPLKWINSSSSNFL